MSTIEVDKLERVNLQCYRAYAAHPLWAKVSPDSDSLQIRTTLGTKWSNGIRFAAFSSDRFVVRVEEILNQFRSEKLPATWRVGPSDNEVDLLKKTLQARGCSAIGLDHGTIAQVATIASGPATNLDIQAVNSTDTVSAYLYAFIQAFEIPESDKSYWKDTISLGVGDSKYSLRHFVGYHKDQPVSCGSIQIGEGFAYLCSGGVVPAARGLGFATDMFRFRSKFAAENGCRAVGTYANDQSLALQRKLGFTVCSKALWFDI